MISTRILSRTDCSDTTQFYTNLVGAWRCAVVVPFVWTTPESVFIAGLMVLIGALGGGGHYLLIRAHRLAPASTLAPFIYTQMVWTTALGFLVFGDVPHRLDDRGRADRDFVRPLSAPPRNRARQAGALDARCLRLGARR